MTTVRTAREVATDLLAPLMRGESGTTVSVVRGVPVPSTGYVVGVPGPGIVVPTSDVDGPTVTAWVDTVRTAASLPGRYVGAWVDGPRVYLDVVEIVADRATAVDYGRTRGELAIFDLTHGVEIETTRTDDAWILSEADARARYLAMARQA